MSQPEVLIAEEDRGTLTIQAEGSTVKARLAGPIQGGRATFEVVRFAHGGQKILTGSARVVPVVHLDGKLAETRSEIVDFQLTGLPETIRSEVRVWVLNLLRSALEPDMESVAAEEVEPEVEPMDLPDDLWTPIPDGDGTISAL